MPNERLSSTDLQDSNCTVTYTHDTDNDDAKASPPPKSRNSWRWQVEKGILLFFHHMRKHVGVGLICAVAYFDPGNWGVDLEAGSQYGYRLLFVILLAGLFAIFLQVLASRLGCVTGLDLASHTRLLLHDHSTHPLLVRWAVLYPLYALAEIAIIATDLAELLGSAVALCLLFPSLELWHGVLITTGDVILLLCLGDPLRGKPLRWFELLIGGLVFAVMICLCTIISRVELDWADVFLGYLPSKYVFPNGAGYVSVGIIGATIMPHSLFLGSALATQDRVSPSSPEPDDTPRPLQLERSFSVASSLLETKRHLKNFFARTFNSAILVPEKGTTPMEILKDTAKNHSQWINNSQEFVKKHIYHGTVDIVVSLLGFAVVINSLILILASAVFFYGGVDVDNAGLFDAYDLIRDLVGKGAATIFALALLCAGQSSSIIATVAGQAVAEGFLRWRVSPFIRRLLTRLIAVIPSMAVAIALGRPGIDALLIASQVVLSIVLPFVSFPLIYLTSKRSVMSVRVAGAVIGPSVIRDNRQVESTFSTTTKDNDLTLGQDAESQANAPDADKIVDYSNNWFATILAFSIWLVIVIANVYVLVTLGDS
ncbi:hypothetical protein D9758_004632 [Tetrapyrgos nigripes]|uniref:Natural resistance-associated macrophage protein n=1 Tax=Tetrapyrgos nigripes TaxID=182062 RepID=A0A8H5GZY8_9AGAR|nr:hypothetical protein D9758_004632 [Tetrapyrgos nigripes]